MSRGMSGDQMSRSGAETKSGGQRDVLLGVGRVPLIKLLAQKTGWSILLSWHLKQYFIKVAKIYTNFTMKNLLILI